MEHFTQAYIEAALWSSNDESDEQGGEPMDSNYGVEDIDTETLHKMEVDCQDFQSRFGQLIESDESQAGHDFWLTRNGHGAGFWDGDWDEPAATILDKACEAYGQFNLYISDDGKVHGCKG